MTKSKRVFNKRHPPFTGTIHSTTASGQKPLSLWTSPFSSSAIEHQHATEHKNNCLWEKYPKNWKAHAHGRAAKLLLSHNIHVAWTVQSDLFSWVGCRVSPAPSKIFPLKMYLTSNTLALFCPAIRTLDTTRSLHCGNVLFHDLMIQQDHPSHFVILLVPWARQSLGRNKVLKLYRVTAPLRISKSGSSNRENPQTHTACAWQDSTAWILEGHAQTPSWGIHGNGKIWSQNPQIPILALSSTNYETLKKNQLKFFEPVSSFTKRWQ